MYCFESGEKGENQDSAAMLAGPCSWMLQGRIHEYEYLQAFMYTIM